MKQYNMEVNSLSKVSSNLSIPFSHSGATPGSHCPMHTALATIRNIKGISSLVVGMPECGYYSRYVMDKPVGEEGELHYVYVLDSNEVVFGCKKGLKEALYLMAEEGAQAVIVIMTCIPALIGEDIYGIAEELNKELQMKTVCIDMAHFKRNGYEAGFYEVYGSLASFLSKNDVKKEQRVSILGAFMGEEGEELENILKENGYGVIKTGHNMSLKHLEVVAGSALNIVTDIHMLPLAKSLKECYHIPYVFLGGSYKIEGLTALYEEIFEILQIKTSFESFRYKQRLEELIEENRRALEGVPFFVTGSIGDVLGITACLSSLKMKPILLHLEEYNEWMEDWRKEILNLADPYITYITKPVEISEENVLMLKDEEKIRPLSMVSGYERTFRLFKMVVDSLKIGGINYQEVKENAII